MTASVIGCEVMVAVTSIPTALNGPSVLGSLGVHITGVSQSKKKNIVRLTLKQVSQKDVDAVDKPSQWFTRFLYSLQFTHPKPRVYGLYIYI